MEDKIKSNLLSRGHRVEIRAAMKLITDPRIQDLVCQNTDDTDDFDIEWLNFDDTGEICVNEETGSVFLNCSIAGCATPYIFACAPLDKRSVFIEVRDPYHGIQFDTLEDLTDYWKAHKLEIEDRDEVWFYEQASKFMAWWELMDPAPKA